MLMGEGGPYERKDEKGAPP